MERDDSIVPGHLKYERNNEHSKNYNDSLINNFNTYDKTLDEIFRYNMYSQNNIKDDNFSKNKYKVIFNGASMNDNPSISDGLLELLDKNSKFQTELVKTLQKESEILSKSYNKSADLYRNQKMANDIIGDEFVVLEKRNEIYQKDINENKRTLEISNYHYKKNKAQTKILYALVFLCILIYIIYGIHTSYPQIVTTEVYSILVGSAGAIFFIYLMYSLYDILMRDDHDFDEYKYYWRKKMDISGVTDIPDELDTTNNIDFGLCNVNDEETNET